MNALEMVKKLSEYFGANLSDVTVEVYLDGLSQLEKREQYLPEILYDTIYPVILQECKWMPKLSEISAIAWKTRGEQLIEENRRWQKDNPRWHSIGLGGYVRGEYDPAVACLPIDPEIEAMVQAEAEKRREEARQWA